MGNRLINLVPFSFYRSYNNLANSLFQEVHQNSKKEDKLSCFSNRYILPKSAYAISLTNNPEEFILGVSPEVKWKD